MSKQLACCGLQLIQPAYRWYELMKLWCRFLWKFRRKPCFFLLIRIPYKLHYENYGRYFARNQLQAWQSYVEETSVVELQFYRRKACQLSHSLWKKICLKLCIYLKEIIVIVSLYETTTSCIVTGACLCFEGFLVWDIQMGTYAHSCVSLFLS